MASLATWYRKWAAQIVPLFGAQLTWIYAERPLSDADAARILREADFLCTFCLFPRRRTEHNIALQALGPLTGAAATALRPRLRAIVGWTGPETPLELPGKFVARLGDRDGGPDLLATLPAADLVCVAVYLALSHIPHSLLRLCHTPGCGQTFLGAKNQRYCPTHQLGARRAVQVRASRAFRQRQKTQRQRTTRRRKR